MSSTDPTRVGGDDMPAALPSTWRALKRGFDAEPALLTVAFTLSLLAALPDALLAVWLKLLADGVTRRRLDARHGRRCRPRRLRHPDLGAARRQRPHPAPLPRPGHHRASRRTSPGCRRASPRSSTTSGRRFSTGSRFCATRCSCSITCTCRCSPPAAGSSPPGGDRRPAGVDPPGAGAARPVRAADGGHGRRGAPAVERAAEQAGAQAQRLSRHLFDAATTAAPGKDVRITGIGRRLVRDRRAAWKRWYPPRSAARALGQRRLAHPGLERVRRRLRRRGRLRGLRAASLAGDVLLLLAAGSRLAGYVSATVGEIGFLRGIWLDGSRRLAWLEDYAAAQTERADRPAPASIERGIALENVSFALPRHRPPGAGERRPHPARGRRRGPGRRERRGQDHAGQAARQDVRAEHGPHPGRRRGPRADAGGRVAVVPRRRVPGLLPLRAAGATDRWSGRRPATRRAAGRADRRRPGPAPRTWSTRWPRVSTRSSAPPGRTASK